MPSVDFSPREWVVSIGKQCAPSNHRNGRIAYLVVLQTFRTEWTAECPCGSNVVSGTDRLGSGPTDQQPQNFWLWPWQPPEDASSAANSPVPTCRVEIGYSMGYSKGPQPCSKFPVKTIPTNVAEVIMNIVVGASGMLAQVRHGEEVFSLFWPSVTG